jgi:hypothetical protein
MDARLAVDIGNQKYGLVTIEVTKVDDAAKMIMYMANLVCEAKDSTDKL